jgi:hypothetical protein
LDKETFNRKLKWLMALRFGFALLLLGSTFAYQIGNHYHALDKPIALLYGLSGTIVLLSAVYVLLLPLGNRYRLTFIYVQISIDSACISLIIFVTGGYSSVFSFSTSWL